MIKRAEKIGLLSSLLQGNVTPKQITAIKDSQKPIQLTLNLWGTNEPVWFEPDGPTFHIEVYSDNTSVSYDRYPDGRIEYRTN